MLQCSDCEFFEQRPDGTAHLRCDPFTNIREPECLQKWQLHDLQALRKSYERTLAMYRRLAPLQEKMMRHMEREIDDLDDADKWKQGYDDDDCDDSRDFL